MLPRDYTAMVEGYNNKQRKHAELIRQGVWAEKSNWEGSISYADWSRRFFPLWFDEIIDDESMRIPTDEEAAQIIETHRKYHRKIKEKKKKR